MRKCAECRMCDRVRVRVNGRKFGVLSPYRIFKFSFAFWMAMRMYCAPPTKIDSILRCLETLCDFASVSRTLLTHNCLSSLDARCLIHSFHSTRSHVHFIIVTNTLDTEAERLLLLAGTAFFEEVKQNLSLLVCPSHENHIILVYCTLHKLTVCESYESYLANSYTHARWSISILHPRALKHT